jgi:hypothetical protein
MSSGVAQAAYPLWSMLAILCAAMSGRMLVAAEREGVRSQGTAVRIGTNIADTPGGSTRRSANPSWKPPSN